MAISEEREPFNKDNIKEQEKTSSPKEEKDTSLFGGKDHVSQDTGKRWVRGNEAYKLTKIPEEKRTEMWGKIAKGTNIHFQTSEAQHIYEEIKKFPERSKEKYGIKSDEERRGMLKMLEKSLGKSFKK